MILVYHNPRCRKSREALALVQDTSLPFAVVDYQKNPLSHSELTEILQKLKLSPIDLVRKNESLWKSSFGDKSLTPKEIVGLMVEHPKLMERPILVYENQAVVGRPIERAKAFLDQLSHQKA